MDDGELLEERANEIREIVENINVPHSTGKLSCTISVGVGINRNNSIGHGDFFELVDGAVFEAKESGRNRVIRADIE
jgi:PleD family two-component response regulator